MGYIYNKLKVKLFLDFIDDYKLTYLLNKRLILSLFLNY